ncbi:MAG: hypothetical protein QM756_23045 [Polyangiaceae bacterium]
MALEAAVIVRGPSGRSFVRATETRQIVPQPTISRLPTSDLCMTLIGGRVVSVVELGGSTGALLVCELGGEPVAFSGLEIERVGLFEVDQRGASVDEQVLPELELGKLLQQMLLAETEELADEAD